MGKGLRFLKRYHQIRRIVACHHAIATQGFRLGSWVSTQRKDKDTMPPERRQRLDALGFVWDPRAARWEKGFGFLKRYRQRKGHCRVPHSYRDPTQASG